MTDLISLARESGVRFLLFSFTDLFGIQRAKLVPLAAVAGMSRDGAGFAGFAAWLELSPADGDVMAIPDPRSFTPLPWQSDVAWVATELTLNGEPMEQCPRRVLQRQIQRAAALGYELRSGVEAEFFLLDPSGDAVADRADTQEKPCYDQLALMRRYPLVSALMDGMEQLGWGPYQADHEDANGQFELNWTYADALTTADRHAFFKVMVKSLAEREGLRASFMPKPFQQLTGNGCHTHISLSPPGAPAASATAATTARTWCAFLMINGWNYGYRMAQPIPTCCRPPYWRRGLMGLSASSIQARAMTTTTTPIPCRMAPLAACRVIWGKRSMPSPLISRCGAVLGKASAWRTNSCAVASGAGFERSSPIGSARWGWMAERPVPVFLPMVPV